MNIAKLVKSIKETLDKNKISFVSREAGNGFIFKLPKTDMIVSPNRNHLSLFILKGEEEPLNINGLTEPQVFEFLKCAIMMEKTK